MTTTATATLKTIKINLDETTVADPLVEVWRRSQFARCDGRARTATIHAFRNDRGGYTVQDGRPYGHVNGADRFYRVDTISQARVAFRRVRSLLEKEGYRKSGLA